jgi:hypothetical protein
LRNAAPPAQQSILLMSDTYLVRSNNRRKFLKLPAAPRHGFRNIAADTDAKLAI